MNVQINTFGYGLLLIMSSLFFSACDSFTKLTSKEDPVFTLMDGEETGFSFTNELYDTEDFNALVYGYFYNGAGIGIADFNNDGLPDIFMAGCKSGSALFINKGNLKFDKAENTNIQTDHFIHGVSIADVNQDGNLDIYLSCSSSPAPEPRANLLYINNGDNTFVEKAEEYGIADRGFTTTSTFFDYDNDGDLDLYVLNHSIYFDRSFLFETQQQYEKKLASMSPIEREVMVPRLYRNDGNRFTDVTTQSGLVDLLFGLSATVADINNDGYLDLYCSGDFISKDHLYMNNGNGTFTDKIDKYLDLITLNSMGSEIVDINNDGLLDIITLDMAPEDYYRNKQLNGISSYDRIHLAKENGYHLQVMRNCLHLNNGDQTFSEIGQLAGISHTDWSWAPLCADFDNDGLKDLFISNGYAKDITDLDYVKYVSPETIKNAGGRDNTKSIELLNAMTITPIKNYVFRNKGSATFEKKTDQWGLSQTAISNGSAYADLDMDGDLDLVVNNLNSPSFLYRNNTIENNPSNKFLAFIFRPEQYNLVQGTKVKVFTDSSTQYQQLVNSRGYLSVVQQVLHFGLGKNNKVKKVEIQYPNGTIQEIITPNLNQHIVLDINDGTLGEFEKMAPKEKILVNIPNAFSPNYVHKESPFNDFRDEPLMEHMCSNKGPYLSIADVNQDGKEDVYVGGASGYPGQLYIQKDGNKFQKKTIAQFTKDQSFEDGQSVFFDADQDGDQDLYVCSGSNEVRVDSLFRNRLYLNDGSGNFQRRMLPDIRTNSSAVEIIDIDSDGDKDLIIGSNVIPKAFPTSYASYILENDGKGNFTRNLSVLPNKGHLGIVNDILIADINADGIKDIVTAGDWAPIQILINSKGVFSNQTKEYGLENTNGLWNCLALIDVNADGKLDIIGGNRGLNNYFQCSADKPAIAYYDDFDYNGDKEAVINYHYRDGVLYPKYTLDEIMEQMPSFRGMFPRYKDYSKATTADIFKKDKYPQMQSFQCKTFSSTVFLAKDGTYDPIELPLQVQYAPVNGIANIGGTGAPLILTAGNNHNVDVYIGKYDADFGVISQWTNTSQSLQTIYSNCGLKGQKRAIKVLSNDIILVANNNGPLQAYKLRSK